MNSQESEEPAKPKRPPNKGSFRPGPDERRHKFTREDCLLGYEKALDKYLLKCVGSAVAKQKLFRRIQKTEQLRYPDAQILPAPKVEWETAADRRQAQQAEPYRYVRMGSSE